MHFFRYMYVTSINMHLAQAHCRCDRDLWAHHSVQSFHQETGRFCSCMHELSSAILILHGQVQVTPEQVVTNIHISLPSALSPFQFMPTMILFLLKFTCTHNYIIYVWQVTYADLQNQYS